MLGIGWDLSPLQRSASPERGPRTSATRPGPLAFEPPQVRLVAFPDSFPSVFSFSPVFVCVNQPVSPCCCQFR
eukprot:2680534-Rhodomonas_salina.1